MFVEIIDKIPALLKSDDQEIALSTPLDTNAEFMLLYKKLIIGTLKLNNGMWIFTYSNDFQKQEEISPITDFPDKNKTYQTRFLFPFFASLCAAINFSTATLRSSAVLNCSNASSLFIVNIQNLAQE